MIARPPRAVWKRVALFLRELRRLEPDHYYYSPSEVHLTILSLFTATENFFPFFAQKERYIAAVDSVFQIALPVRIIFEGITASSSAVMIQGFFETQTLNRLRDRLRRQLGMRGLGKGIDQRYRLQTAHMTVVRFCAPLRHPKAFAQALEQARRRTFGSMTVRRFYLVQNDWYMSRRITSTLKRYPLIQRPALDNDRVVRGT